MVIKNMPNIIRTGFITITFFNEKYIDINYLGIRGIYVL